MIKARRRKVNKNRARYVLTIPCWMLLVVVIGDALRVAVARGPIFSNQF